MNRTLAILALCLPLSPALAQEAPPPPSGDVEEGVDLLEEGAKLLLRGLLSEMEPALDEMERALTEMEPAVRELIALIGDMRNYEAPEKLSNGDIIIRRKVPLAPAPDGPPGLSPDVPGPNGEIDL